MKRTLGLKREALTELTADELAYVVGGASDDTCKLVDKVTNVLDCHSYRCTR